MKDFIIAAWSLLWLMVTVLMGFGAAFLELPVALSLLILLVTLAMYFFSAVCVSMFLDGALGENSQKNVE